MKTRLLSVVALFAALTCTAARAESGPKLIQSYTDVLAVIPEEFAPQRISQWTELNFFKADFENLWGDSTLCLRISDCTFTKEATTYAA
jgi:hypothetical protein